MSEGARPSQSTLQSEINSPIKAEELHQGGEEEAMNHSDIDRSNGINPTMTDGIPQDDQLAAKMDQEAQKPAPTSAPPASGLAAPDGGLQAWLVALGCFCAFFASFGFVVSFGVFQSYYESEYGPAPGRTGKTFSPDDIAWIGSLQLAGLYGLAIPSAVVNDKLGPQLTVALGGVFVILGVFTASAAKTYWQTFLSHGICVTIGLGLIYIPAVVLPQQWFDKKRALVTGLCVGGSSVGGVIWSVVFNEMVNHRGYTKGWGLRVIGFVQLFLFLVSVFTIKGRLPRNLGIKLSSFPILIALKDPKFALFCFASMCGFFGLYIPYFFVPQYAIAIGASASAGFYMSAVLNATTFFGRIVLGKIADHFGAWNTLTITVLICSMLNFAWSGVDSNAGLWVYVAIYGFFSGAVASLQGPCNLVLCPQPKAKLLGAWIAIGSLFSAVGSLGGEPIGGRLIRNEIGKHASNPAAIFYPAMYFSGAILLLSAISFGITRIWITRGARI